MNKEELTLEQKVDLILAYQKSAARWSRVRSLISLILFFLLVVAPIVATVYMVQALKNVDWNQQLEGLKNSAFFPKVPAAPARD